MKTTNKPTLIEALRASVLDVYSWGLAHSWTILGLGLVLAVPVWGLSILLASLTANTGGN